MSTLRFVANHHVAIFGTTSLLLAPALWAPQMTHDSFWIDWVWADQFNKALAAGVLYPRWLPLSHGGLGSPVFYFYPPLTFYISGLFGLIGLSTYATVIGAFAISFVVSGYAMLAWLKPTRNPLLGAIFFMVAPYHIFDFYGRGAQAECLAIAFLPLVALGLRDRRSRLLAIAYAGLILSHLPLALLATVFMIAPAIVAWRKWHEILSLAAGVGLSAIYLLPALMLGSFRDAGALSRAPGLQPSNWSFFWSRPQPSGAILIILLSILLSFIPILAILLYRRDWKISAYGFTLLLIAAGVIPAIWDLPLLRSVQFPFRMFPLAEFAMATGLANLTGLWPMAVAPALALSSMFALGHPTGGPISPLQLARDHPDVPENLPPGLRPYSSPSQWALREANGVPQGAVFAFPAWHSPCEKRNQSGGRGSVILKPTPKCPFYLDRTLPERLGALISLLSIALLAMVRRRSPEFAYRGGTSQGLRVSPRD